MNNSIITIPHFGAYGIIIHQENMLLVCKSRGPYRGLLDLPGGKIEEFQSTQNALKRKIKEETGLIIKEYEMVGYYECSVPLDETHEMNHRGMIYSIGKLGGKLNTESAAQWQCIDDVKESQLTPFAWQAVSYLLKANFHNLVHNRLSNNSAFSTDK